MVQINAQGMTYRALNEELRRQVLGGATEIELANVNGHRYVGDGLSGDVRIGVTGVPGNDLAAFMAGPTIEVRNNAQDGVANTMQAGTVIIHGDAGDVLGYGMRGGTVFVRGNVGYRVGIHMKAYRGVSPTVVVGGTAGDFFGEYLAGGTLLLLGLERQGRPLVGSYCGTGMHGGVIYLRGEYDPHNIALEQVAIHPLDDGDRQTVGKLVGQFAELFGLKAEPIMEGSFAKLLPRSRRPYGGGYVSQP